MMTSFDHRAIVVTWKVAFLNLRKNSYASAVPCWGAWAVAQVNVKADEKNNLPVEGLLGADQVHLALRNCCA